MAVHLHVTNVGHKCRNPFKGKVQPASYIKAGEMLGLGEWFLQYSEKQKAYFVIHDDLKGDYYQFNNFDCACAKLAELGGKK